MSLPEDFNPKTYINLNPDLSSLSLEESIRHWILHGEKERRPYRSQKWKTFFGLENYLFLNSELDFHYNEFIYSKIDYSFIQILVEYISKLESLNREFKMYILPDKSVICKEYTSFKNEKTHSLYDKITCQLIKDCLTPKDYYLTDTHLNHTGMLKSATFILHDLTGVTFDPEYNLHMVSRLGDLASYPNNPETLGPENVTMISFKDKAKNIAYKLKLTDRFIYHRTIKYLEYLDSPSSNKILILGDSSSSEIISEYFSLYYRQTMFIWNHWYIPEKIIAEYNPDIILDIRTERFLNMNSLSHKSFDLYTNPVDYIKNYTIFSYDEIIKILTFCEPDISKNIFLISEIEENIEFLSKILSYGVPNYKELLDKEDINLNLLDIVNLHEDIYDIFKERLVIIDDYATEFYPGSANIFLKNICIHEIYNKNRKISFQHIPPDFNWKRYTELNIDLRHLSKRQLYNHYENNGFFQKRNYV